MDERGPQATVREQEKEIDEGLAVRQERRGPQSYGPTRAAPFTPTPSHSITPTDICFASRHRNIIMIT